MARKQRQMLAAGARAPEFDLRDTGGERHSLQSLIEHGPVLLAFFKVSCPVCQYTLPFLERIHRQAGDGNAPVRIIGISQDGARDTEEFSSEFGLTFPMLLDEAAAGYPASNAFGIGAVPSLFLVEPDGGIATSEAGFSKRELEEVGRRAGVAPFQPGERVPEMRPG
jgi:peroxiredoxin